MKKLIAFMTALILSVGAIFSQNNLLNENLTIYAGNGTANEPYLITNATQLDLLRTFQNAEDIYFRLENDINLSDYITDTYGEEGWLPIGDYMYEFMGYFDGNGHRISGLWINRPDDDDIGLFGFLYHTATVHNLIVELDARGVNGYSNVGGLAGMSDATITNCAVTGNGMIKAQDFAGGLVGFQLTNEISGCYSTANVYCNSNTTDGFGGGLVGGVFTATISHSYAVGAVHANLAGGLVGMLIGDINSSYAAGRVCGNEYAGGLIGDDADGVLTNCFFDTTTTGQEESGSFAGEGTGLATADIISVVPFNALKAGQEWKSSTGSYPYLSWQESSLPEENNVPTSVSLTFYNAENEMPLAAQSGDDGIYQLPGTASAVYISTDTEENSSAYLPYTKESPLLLAEVDTEYPFYLFRHSFSGIIQPSLLSCIRNSDFDSNEHILEDVYIKTSTGRIDIDTPVSIPVTLYTITGKIAASQQLQQGSNSIELSSGVYILRINNKSIKVVIR